MIKFYDYYKKPTEEFRDAYYLYLPNDAEVVAQFLDTAGASTEGLYADSEGWHYWDEATCEWLSEAQMQYRVDELKKALSAFQKLERV